MDDLKDRIARFQKPIAHCLDHGIPCCGGCSVAFHLLFELQSRIDTDTETIYRLQVEHRRQRERIEELERGGRDYWKAEAEANGDKAFKLEAENRKLQSSVKELDAEVERQVDLRCEAEEENRKLREALERIILAADDDPPCAGCCAALAEAALSDKGGE